MTYVALVLVWSVVLFVVLGALLLLVRTLRHHQQVKGRSRSYYSAMRDLNTPKKPSERYRW